MRLAYFTVSLAIALSAVSFANAEGSDPSHTLQHLAKMSVNKSLKAPQTLIKAACTNAPNTCCCKTGGYGACMTAQDCKDLVDGKCVPNASGC
jgi:hypothetical protein